MTAKMKEDGPLQCPPPVVDESVSTDASRWAKYPSLNDADLVQVRKVQQAAVGAEFVATEKVHGSNFAFETDGVGISYFSRNNRLVADARFVGRTAPLDAMGRYHGAVLEAFRICAGGEGGVRSVVIYGEYFGGWFPHDEVRPEGPGAGAPVQKGVVAYAPGHHFFAFDVCADGDFLDFDDARDLLLRAGFPLVAAPLVRGSFEDCMGFDVESLRTTLPGLLGLPHCEEYSIAEGIVVRPVLHRQSWVIKKKSVRYLEACPDELNKWLSKCVESKAEAFAGLFLSLCRRPRLEAVLSKEPQLRLAGMATLQRVQLLFREDVQNSFDKALQRSKMAPPTGCRLMAAAHTEADRRVEAWLLE